MASKITTFLFAFLLLTSMVEAQEVFRTVLDNGLTVLIQEVPGAETVSIYSCFKTGSATEGKSLGKGISHFVEHMMFKGTARRPVGAIAKEVKSLGGVINASTSHDYTMYTIDVPKEAFKQGLDIASDMVQNSLFDAAEMEKERKVIHGEMGLYNDRPERMLSDLVYTNVYKVHPYQHPIIGYPVLFDSITHEELYGYYKERYIPNNMILSIAGGVVKEDILPLIKAAYKDFTPAAYLMRNLPQEPSQTMERYLEKEYKTDLIRFSIAYESVSVLDPDLYALDVLAMAMGVGGSSRLYKELYKNKHWVEEVSASNFTPQDRGVFEILGTMSEDHLREVLGAIRAMIADIQKKGLSASELEKTKRLTLSGYVFANQTPSSMASRAAIDEALTSDPHFSHHYVEQVKKVTNEDIKRVAKQYLQDARLNVTVLRPPKPVEKKNQAALSKGEITKHVLDNGLTVLLREDPSVQIASLRLAVWGGLRFEDDSQGGLTEVMGSAWAKGTARMTEDAIDQAMEERGARLSSSGGMNTLTLDIDVMAEDLDFALNMMEDLVKDPSFSDEVIAREKKDVAVQRREREDDIMSFSSRKLTELLYQKHPLHKDPLGTPESIAGLSRRDIVDSYHRFMRSDNMVIAVYGNINAQKVLNTIKTKFSSISKGKVEVPLFNEEAPVATRVQELKMDKEQALLLMAFRAPAVKDNDRVGMEIINNLLGGGLGGRLFVKVREEMGQAYTTSAQYSPNLDTGTFVLYVLTTPQKVDSVRAIVSREIENLRTQEISSEELQSVKAYLKGSRVRSLLTNSALSGTTAIDELLGLGYNNYKQYNAKVDAMTAGDIKRIADTYLDINKAAIIITTPKDAK